MASSARPCEFRRRTSRRSTISSGLHPSLAGLAGLLEDHSLAIVQGVGYPNPNESHFRSMDIWQAGSMAENLNEGWLGKALVSMPASPAFHVASADEPSWLALAGAPAKVPSITNLEQFQLQTNAASGADHDRQRQLIERDAARPTPGTAEAGKAALLDFVRHTAVNTYANSQRLRELSKDYQPKVPYPASGLANRLKLVAQLIEADLGARVFYVTLNGFDTHANQLTVHANLLRELSDAMTAFYKDMSARGHRERLLMMTFSEFGRRAKENQSQGTDHGSAAPMFLSRRPGEIGSGRRASQLERSLHGQAQASHRFPPSLRRGARPLARRLQQASARRRVQGRRVLEELNASGHWDFRSERDGKRTPLTPGPSPRGGERGDRALKTRTAPWHGR